MGILWDSRWDITRRTALIRTDSARIKAVRRVMSHRESHNFPIHSVDVGEITLDAAGMHDREFRVYRRIEMLFGEETPVREDAAILLALELRTPGPVVESFVATEEKRRHRAAEAERIAPIVRCDESPIDAGSDLSPAIGSIDP